MSTVGYNRQYSRFKSGAEASRARGASSIGAGMDLYKLLNMKEGGLMGQASSQDLTGGYEGTLGDAIKLAKTDTNMQSLVNQAYGGTTGMSKGEAWTTAVDKFKGMKGSEGTGLLGGIEKIGTGIDTLTGGYASKATGAIGDFAMKHGGQAIKDFGTKAMGNIAQSAVGEGVKALVGGVAAVAGPVMMAKQVYDFANETVDAYEDYEQGVENAEFGLVDLESQRRHAKGMMQHQNKEVGRLITDASGTLSDKVAGKAEQVLSSGEVLKGRSGLETDSTANVIEGDRANLIAAYTEGSGALTRKEDNLKTANVSAYSRENQRIMGAESDVQANIDEMQQAMDDMEWMYKGAKTFQKLSPLAHIEGKV